MGNSSRRFSFVGSGYTISRTGGVEFLENVRIPIWSTKCDHVALVRSSRSAGRLRTAARGYRPR